MPSETTSGDLPVTGAWREGDAAGNRRWFDLTTPLDLESGGVLPGVRLAYETWGTLAPDRSNAVLVLHALTGDSHLAGPAGPGHVTAGWWDALVGPGRPLDPERWFLVVPNMVGGCQGSTGPASRAPDGSPWGGRFPGITVRDMVTAEVALADAMGVERWAAVIGGSMGGMRALEWAVGYPERVAALAVFACGATTTADQIAWASPQLHAIRADAEWRGGDYYDSPPGGGPWRGLGIARRIAHVTYRSEPELTHRFGRRPQDSEDPANGGRYAVESYLDHHADKLVRRFDAGSYVALTEALRGHDVGRGRGGSAEALRRVTAHCVVAGVDSDRLYPMRELRALAAGLPGAGSARVISSPYGHDGFLIEHEQVGALIRETLPGRDREVLARPLPGLRGMDVGRRQPAVHGGLQLLDPGEQRPDAAPVRSGSRI